jgi:hypothetical protein
MCSVHTYVCMCSLPTYVCIHTYWEWASRQNVFSLCRMCSLYVECVLDIHTYIHIYIHTYIRTCIHSYIHTFVHTYIHTYTSTHIHTYTQTHTYIHTYKHTHLHTHTHTHTHTHIHTWYVQIPRALPETGPKVFCRMCSLYVECVLYTRYHALYRKQGQRCFVECVLSM